jgi:hypothetical protein
MKADLSDPGQWSRAAALFEDGDGPVAGHECMALLLARDRR